VVVEEEVVVAVVAWGASVRKSFVLLLVGQPSPLPLSKKRPSPEILAPPPPEFFLVYKG
jgi:hypothetical protein